MFSFVPTGNDVQSVSCNRLYTLTGTSFLDAFQSCLLMKLGARRRMKASCLDCPGRISRVPVFNNAVIDDSKTVIITLASPTGGSVLGTNILTALTIYDDDRPRRRAVRK